MPLPDLLQWLASAGKTGTLQVERNHLKKWILLEQGCIAGCSSDDPPQRLGQYLLSRELVTPEQLRTALEAQSATGQHLGEVLVQSGVLSPDDLSKHLEAKAEETIYSVFDWEDGVFRFEEDAPEVRGAFRVRLQVQDVLLRGLKRYDDMQRIRQVFDDPGIVLRYTSLPPGPEIFNNKMARMMYSAIDGDRSVAEILLHVHGSEYVVHKFLFELHRNGYIEIAGRKETAPPPAAPPLVSAAVAPPPRHVAREEPPPAPRATPPAEPDLPPFEEPFEDDPQPEAEGSVEARLHQARELMASGQHETALDTLERLYRQQPENDSLRRLTAEAEAEFIDRAYKHFLPPDKVPVLTRPVESLSSESLSPQEFFLLSRIDGVWDLKSIIALAPLREVEALRTLKRMREMGMVELRDPAR